MSALMIASIIVLSIGGSCLLGVILFYCKYKGLCCFPYVRPTRELLPSESLGNMPDEDRRERERLRVERRMRIMEIKLRMVRFEEVKEGAGKQAQCSICFEDFSSETMVRETPCKHLFHSPCLFQWVKAKIE
jgi:hypothetical protein